MPTRFDAHIPEGLFELYSMGRLPEEQLEEFEEHLLVCSNCQDQLTESDRFVRVMREATRRASAVSVPAKSAWSPRWAWGMAMAGALAVLLTVPQFRGPAAAEQEVALSAMRGAESPAAPHAVPNRPLTVRIDVTELGTAPAFALEIVDAGGRPVWQGRANVKDGKIVQPTGVKLTSGQYWVRLYSDNSERQLLREFSLSVTN